MSTACQVQDLCRDYGRLRALDNISFAIPPGEVFGLIGPNGSGKTTALRIIASILKPTAGRVTVFGTDIAADPGRVRRLISYLPEDAGAYKGLTGKQYLDFMTAFYAPNRIARQAMLRQAEELCGLGDRLRNKVKTYSKGMARKLLLARALATGPKLAILDEPTSGLDVISSIELRNRIRAFARQGTTFLVSSHNMLEVEFLCDRVALLNCGRIAARGSPGELKEKYESRNLEEVFMRVAR